jgi:hypothetical protein
MCCPLDSIGGIGGASVRAVGISGARQRAGGFAREMTRSVFMVCSDTSERVGQGIGCAWCAVALVSRPPRITGGAVRVRGLFGTGR